MKEGTNAKRTWITKQARVTMSRNGHQVSRLDYFGVWFLPCCFWQSEGARGGRFGGTEKEADCRPVGDCVKL